MNIEQASKSITKILYWSGHEACSGENRNSSLWYQSEILEWHVLNISFLLFIWSSAYRIHFILMCIRILDRQYQPRKKMNLDPGYDKRIRFWIGEKMAFLYSFDWYLICIQEAKMLWILWIQILSCTGEVFVSQFGQTFYGCFWFQFNFTNLQLIS